MHKRSTFVTLTYNDEELPDNAALLPTHLSRFIKNLRTKSSRPISFFGCGEYGERTQRPHYHALLFGVDFLDQYTCPDPTRPDIRRSETLESLWGLGHTELGSVTMASASYVAGYVRKKVRSKHYARANPLTGELLHPEFARMSLRPAVGNRWIRKYWNDVYPRDYVVIDGVKAKPPRYYDKWMDQYFPYIMEEVRQRRYEKQEDLTKYQLTAGEKIHQSRVDLFQRRDAV